MSNWCPRGEIVSDNRSSRGLEELTPFLGRAKHFGSWEVKWTWVEVQLVMSVHSWAIPETSSKRPGQKWRILLFWFLAHHMWINFQFSAVLKKMRLHEEGVSAFIHLDLHKCRGPNTPASSSQLVYLFRGVLCQQRCLSFNPLLAPTLLINFFNCSGWLDIRVVDWGSLQHSGQMPRS